MGESLWEPKSGEESGKIFRAQPWTLPSGMGFFLYVHWEKEMKLMPSCSLQSGKS